MHVYIEKLGQYVGQQVTLKGWVRGIRSSGKLHFITLRDGSGDVQCVMFKGDVSPELFERAGHLRQESAVAIEGT
ncbi:MAG TPA: OB-fold nucleic acid binding domain-containing protein, partial [Polyangiales bacterium]